MQHLVDGGPGQVDKGHSSLCALDTNEFIGLGHVKVHCDRHTGVWGSVGQVGEDHREPGDYTEGRDKIRPRVYHCIQTDRQQGDKLSQVNDLPF